MDLVPLAVWVLSNRMMRRPRDHTRRWADLLQECHGHRPPTAGRRPKASPILLAEARRLAAEIQRASEEEGVPWLRTLARWDALH